MQDARLIGIHGRQFERGGIGPEASQSRVVGDIVVPDIVDFVADDVARVGRAQPVEIGDAGATTARKRQPLTQPAVDGKLALFRQQKRTEKRVVSRRRDAAAIAINGRNAPGQRQIRHQRLALFDCVQGVELRRRVQPETVVSLSQIGDIAGVEG